jgi:1-deoxyxylulose-5-phosphate synthase
VYSDGSSEEITGQVLGEHAKRDEVVIATKLNGRMGPGPNGSGLSRGAVMTQIDASLRRLGTDYVDLYQIHRWDPRVPIEETMEALHDVVRAGKARYLGASSMYAWQFAQAQYVGWDTTTPRSETDGFGGRLYRQAVDADRRVADAVAAVAKDRDVPRAQVALAWLLHQPTVPPPRT